MKMLRWIAGITRLDHICNEDIRQRFGVASVAEKPCANRLRWFGHVSCADNDSFCKISFNLGVVGKD
ncbi:hypothetical protein ANCDUO_22637 [Ancylostoma duodenale]|uniref:Uncharacterized protein n=1 Tax=Ancylostoma duodenale TaxID=51022 RepID=A0A0C2FFC2_9BILA|nr:hypothetical protein ANCDUO_22637 [Ancylostoma duodenale]